MRDNFLLIFHLSFVGFGILSIYTAVCKSILLKITEVKACKWYGM